ncbi:hypothetical protein ACX3YD_31850 [Pseudomonas fluorescens group sp. PF-1]
MRKLFIYALVGLSLVGCNSSRDSGGAAGTAAVEHERTLRYSKAEDGSTVIQAIRITNGQRAVDTAAGKDAVQSRGGFMNQVAFKECGRVNFASTGPGEGVVQGIHTGRGMTAKCKIRNWDGQWHIVESR